jgi:hypothetical protein
VAALWVAALVTAARWSVLHNLPTPLSLVHPKP